MFGREASIGDLIRSLVFTKLREGWRKPIRLGG